VDRGEDLEKMMGWSWSEPAVRMATIFETERVKRVVVGISLI
jgi:hypothetical protein